MTISLDISDDLQYVDGAVSLTLRISGATDQLIPWAIDEPVTWKEAQASQGQVRQGDQTWIWPARYTPSRAPLGATLVDDGGTVWTILALLYKDVVGTWEATCRALAVEAGLNNKVTILRATYTKNSGGEAIPTWAAIANGTDIAARFQPTAQSVDVREDADWTSDEHEVICASLPHLPLAAGDYRAVDSGGVHYRITGYKQAERIDALPVLTVLRIFEGAEGQSSSSSSSSSSSGA